MPAADGVAGAGTDQVGLEFGHEAKHADEHFAHGISWVVDLAVDQQCHSPGGEAVHGFVEVSKSAFVYYNPGPSTRGAMVLSDGLPADGDHRRCHPRWLRPWLTGDDQDDALLLGIGFNRMRKTYLERTRTPTAHTPATLAGYLSRMDTVRFEGFQIVHEALADQVESALTRREMTLVQNAMVAGDDTALGVCTDFTHSPLDGGRTCSQNFLSCLDCSNARALPRHLPMQLAVLDALRDLRAALTAHRWVLEYAGRIAQIEDMLSAYEPAQVREAREKISDDERRLALRLLDGVFDTP